MFGSSTFGGFGQQNQQNQQQQPGQQTGGLFGQQTQQQPGQNGAFGTTGGGFGASQPTQTGGGLFGQPQQQQPQQSGGFSFGGANNAASVTPAFGARPPASTGFGGFGASNTTTPATGGFSFGANANQPQQQNTGFGSTTSTFGAAQPSGGLFGQQQQQQPAATGGFGGAFGQAAAPAGQPGQITQGTATVPYDPVREDLSPSEHIKDRKNWDVQQSIVVMPAYINYSHEELRLMDYQQGRSKGNVGPGGAASGTGFGFGASGSTNTFGQPQQPAATGFGATQPTAGGGLFGQQQQPQQTGGLFGQQNNQQQSGGLFGAKPATTGFSATNTTGGGLFGQNQQQPQQGGLFGSTAGQTGQQTSSGFSFGGTNNNTAGQTGTGFAFGGANNQQQQNKPAFGSFSGATQTTQPASGISFGGANNQQQQPGQTGTGFGVGAGTTGGFSFGQKPATGSLFGNTASQPGAQPGAAAPSFGGFGGVSATDSQQNKPAFSFGGSTGGFGGTSGAATGAIAAPATGGGLFSNTNSTNTSQPGGLFGGASNTGGAGTGFSLGGQQQNQQAGQIGTTGGFGTGGLFGNKPAGQTGTQPATGGLFSNTGQQQGGTGFGTGGGLFGGAAASKPGGFSFGGGSLFGSQQNNQQQGQQQQSGGLFGNSNTIGGSSLFGAGAGQQQSGTTGGGLFGGSSLFGSNAGGGLGQSQNAQGGLFGQSQGQQNQQQPTVQASLDVNPYGTDNLFASSLGPQAQGAAAQAPLPFNVAPKNKPPLVAPFRASPRSAAKITRLRGSTPVTNGFAGRESTPGSAIREGTPGSYIRFGTPGRAGSPSLFKGLSDEHSAPLSSQAFVSRPSSKRLVLDEPGDNSFSTSRSGILRSGSVPQLDTGSSPLTSTTGFLRSGTAAPANRVSFSPALEQRAESVRPGGGDLSFNASLSSRRGSLFASTASGIDETPSKPIAAAPAKTAAFRPGRDLESSFVASSEPTPVTAKKGEYYLEPSLSALRTARFEELAAVHSFIVGRQGVGKVEFLEPVDLTTLPDLTDIAGGVVQFRLKEIVVYPEEEDVDPRNPKDGQKHGYNPVHKAAQGTGLNVPARVSLDGCWPIDRATREALKDSNHPRVKQHINKLKHRSETEFVDYEAETGTWTFKVKHFSRYGLDDSDEDDEGAAAPAAKTAAATTPKQQQAGKRSNLSKQIETDDEDDAPPSSQALQDATSTIEADSEEETSSAMHESELGASPPTLRSSVRMGFPGRSRSATPLASHHPETNMTPSRSFATGVEARRVQVMQASFFGQDDSQASATVMTNPRKHNRTTQNRAVTKAARSSFEVEVEPAPEVARPARKLTRLDLAQSVVKGSEGLAMDAGLAMGRSFRVGWGLDGSIVHNGKILGAGAANAIKAATGTEEQQAGNTVSTIKLEKLKIFKDQATTESEADKAERLLKVQLSHSIIEEDERGLPVAYTQYDTRFRDFAQAFEAKDRSFEACLWRLGVVLFDEIDLKLSEGTSTLVTDRVLNLRRKTALSNWLRHTVAGTVETESRSHIAASRKAALVFSYLSGNQIERASQAALEAADLRLATLIAQSGGDEETKADLSEQLLIWRQEGVDAHISKDHRRIYELLSGNATLSKGNTSRDPVESVPDLAIAAGLDWKRAFGLHLWYESTYESSVSHTFSRYETSIGGLGGTAPPLPSYRESSHLGTLRLKQLVQSGGYDKDALFELIKLYAQPTHDLESALNPCSFGPSNSDFRLPWHLYDLLSRVLRQRDFSDREELGLDADTSKEGNSARADGLASSFAAQLELIGQWKWSAFVLLHLELSVSREMAVKALLARNVFKLDEETQTFLCEELHIPIEWIYTAKAYEARRRDDRYKEYTHLLSAGDYPTAHSIAVHHLAPEALIRGDLALILSLFSPFYDKDVPGWEEGGSLYLTYVSACRSSEVDTSRVEKGISGLFPQAEKELVQRVARTEMVAGLTNLKRWKEWEGYAEVGAVQSAVGEFVDVLLSV